MSEFCRGFVPSADGVWSILGQLKEEGVCIAPARYGGDRPCWCLLAVLHGEGRAGGWVQRDGDGGKARDLCCCLLNRCLRGKLVFVKAGRTDVAATAQNVSMDPLCMQDLGPGQVITNPSVTWLTAVNYPGCREGKRAAIPG